MLMVIICIPLKGKFFCWHLFFFSFKFVRPKKLLSVGATICNTHPIIQTIQQQQRQLIIHVNFDLLEVILFKTFCTHFIYLHLILIIYNFHYCIYSIDDSLPLI